MSNEIPTNSSALLLKVLWWLVSTLTAILAALGGFTISKTADNTARLGTIETQLHDEHEHVGQTLQSIDKHLDRIERRLDGGKRE